MSKSLNDDFREVAASVKKAGDAELYEKIVALQGEVVELSTRNLELEKKNGELQAELDLRKNLRHERSLYFLQADPVPYCPLCWEKSKKLIHLFGVGASDPHWAFWECHACLYNFSAKDGTNFHPEFDRHRAYRVQQPWAGDLGLRPVLL
jgi:hypothetical protein